MSEIQVPEEFKNPEGSLSRLADNPSVFDDWAQPDGVLFGASFPYMMLCRNTATGTLTWHALCNEYNIPDIVERGDKGAVDAHISEERKQDLVGIELFCRESHIFLEQTPIKLAGPQHITQILALQGRSSARLVTDLEERQAQGYVSFETTIELLNKLREEIGIVVAVNADDNVVGYEIPISLKTAAETGFFENYLKGIGGLTACERPFDTDNSVIIAQICLDSVFKGQGLDVKLHQALTGLITHTSKSVEYILTGISATNPRSQRAAIRNGFQHLADYQEGNDPWKIFAQKLPKL